MTREEKNQAIEELQAMLQDTNAFLTEKAEQDPSADFSTAIIPAVVKCLGQNLVAGIDELIR